MNTVCLVGRIMSKPNIRYNSNNIPFTRFTLAINRNFKSANGEREADFINVVVWRKPAENVCQYLDKGSLIGIDGRIQTGSYTGQDGNKKYTTDVIAENVQFLESKKRDNQTPYDYENTPSETNNQSGDVFADFGEQVSIEDNFLE